ncbi:hypothetical protein VTO42DRAFT_2154 [Malbranchea cinnamomea]
MLARNLTTVALSILFSILLAPSVAFNFNKPPSKNAVLLSDVQALTFHAGRQTTHRRVPPIPQLNCVGPPEVCALYNVDVMRCVNAGSDYDENDVQWTCTAEVPPEFKLGSTDVVCEGYRSADDPWVLKGSCGVEYRLLLTELGEKKYGRLSSSYSRGSGERNLLEYFFDWFVTLLVIGIFIFALGAICFGSSRRRWADGGRSGWGWFGGGGGGWFPPGPPPPYEPGFTKYESWRPGFWSGALGGAAAGYALGRGSRSRGRESRPGPSSWSSSPPGPSRPSSGRVESTGFGSTRRR